ncbi:ATP-binding protein [Nannocystis bainbridge]|uniref:histidine kinase n=1 Tax=Nannocystis bainbridge TaxID=2995303 RepID=A0ABT5E3N0_9BACT|nr:ATP-binding protein [Nannocystis bainbridge]MDC0720476.1 ATP-binding protein [Nannocystis bainbridge]
MIPGTELAELLDDGLLVVSHTGEVRSANPAAERMLGAERSALLGRDLASLLPGAPEGALHDACAGARESSLRATDRRGFGLAVRVVPRAADAWVFLRGEVDPTPAPITNADVVRTILDHAPVVLFAVDADATITLSEGHGLAMLGRAPGANVGRSCWDAYHDVPWILDSVRKALAGEPVTIVGELRGRVFDVHYAPVREGAGDVTGVLGVALDVTERERAMEKLASQRSVLKYLLANVPQAIFWKDRQCRFLGCNQKFLEHTGLTDERQLLGKTDHDIWASPEESDFFRLMDERVMSSGVPILDIEEPLRRPDGRQTFILTSKVPLRDDAGQVTGLLGIYVDITERKRIELESQRAKEAADAALRAKSEFLTVMSHELRTPLTLILGPLEALLADPAEPLSHAARASLSRTWRNAARLGRLVDDILDYQKLEAGKMKVVWEPVDVHDLVEDLVADAEPAARSAGITLRHDLAPDVRTVPLDPRMFEKIVLNLLGNALKFTPAGGTVTVSLERADDGQLRLEVADTGPGIAPEEHERVFQRFQQLDTASSRKHEGLGLGLAIVREFAEAMGGRVRLCSELGDGACFVVELPIDADRLARMGPPQTRTSRLPLPVEPAALEAVEPPSPAPGRPRVIVAEDNPDMRAFIAAVLRPDHDIVLTVNGAEALAAARERRPDVIVSDIMMPEMDGYELVTRLKRAPDLRDIPVIVLSAKASREETVRGLEVGADDYLPKPFAPAELRARIGAALRLHRVHLEIVAQKQELEQTLRILEETQDQLVQSSKMAAVGTLVAGLSHELNNPVAIIRMSAQMLLRRGSRDPFVRRTLERIERHSQRCAGLVEALLAYSRRRPQVAERCELGQVLSWLLELARPEALERGIRLVAEFVPEKLPALVVHRPALESALLNVIGNAADATGRGGIIEVTARAATGDDDVEGAEILVRDSGVGIAPQALPHVFEPFYTTKAPGKGTGLGLPMTQKFVQAHGGSIRVDSELGRGTAVRIWLPLVPSGPSEPPEAQEAP